MFGRLHRNVPQEKLDLLQLASRCVAEPSTGPPQIVRCQPRHSNVSGGFLHNVPNRLYRHPISPSSSHFVDTAEQLASINCGCGEPIIPPNREPEPSECGLPYQPDQQWPSALRAAGDDPRSKPRLHAVSTHTRVAMRARPGRVFLSVADDRVLAKAHCLALPLTSSRAGCPASSPLLRDEYRQPSRR